MSNSRSWFVRNRDCAFSTITWPKGLY